MAERKPLVRIDGETKQLPDGDVLDVVVQVVGGDIDGGNASTTYAGVPIFDFGSSS